MNDEPVYRRANVLWRRTYDRVVMLVPDSGEFLALQATGCDLWAALEDPGSLGEIAKRLVAVYGAPVEQVISDIAPVVEELRRRGVLVVSRYR